MPFHRFEDMENHVLTAHLSSGRAPIVEGKYLYFCLNQKEAGTGSELHYHPNELLIFVTQGTVNAVVGKDRRLAPTGTFILVPPNVRHSMKATEDGPCAYLYIKDRTWTVVGIGADEAPPERPMTMAESEEIVRTGKRPDKLDAAEKSAAIIEGVPDCYYSLLPGLQGPPRYGRRIEWIEGERGAFGLYEIPNGYKEESTASEHEQFLYVCSGSVQVTVGNESKQMSPGDIAEIPRGMAYRIEVEKGAPATFVATRSTHYLEDRLDQAKAS